MDIPTVTTHTEPPGVPAPGSSPDTTGTVRTDAGLRFTGLAPTLGALARATVARTPDAEAVVDLAAGVRLSYRQLWDAASRVAGGLAHSGVRTGDRVAVPLPNGAPWCVAVLGAMLAGAVPVPVNPRLTDAEVDHILGDSGAAAVLDDPTALPDGEPLVRPAEDPESPGAIFYTSGTTGRPKGAVLSHRALLSAAEQCRRALHLGKTEPTRALVAAPLFHVLAFGMQWLPALAAGGTVVIAERFEVGAWLRAASDERIDVLNGVPAMYWQALHHADFARADTSSVRLVCYGAAPTPPDQVRALLDAFPGARLAPGYGLTEAACVTGLDHADTLAHSDAVGTAVAATELRLDGPEAASGTGELLVRGPQLMSGYWRNAQASAKALDGGWLRTGDLVRIDAEGRVRMLDRRTDMINRGGENAYSVEVETALSGYPGVAEIAVVGVPDPRLGHKVGAVVVPRPGATIDVGGIVAYGRRRLAAFKIPEYVAVRPDPLPRNAAGKVDKPTLRSGTTWAAPH
ncbi:class I adenylate-forming enzyme family protein [Pseudonocardia sp.]|uniref:class I adenylate-forming enzyme family protein n=1 Tax=Pseudonocardia sp. TaxID=60912 RepID=UPI00260936DA|nr:AMP-binding protein [Pseudonocardia sp.]MCW2717883.1 putative fatty-acid--CoA ligase [Pseudonocardia sp.]